MHDIEDEAERRREIRKKYLWREGEREAIEREMAERQKRIDAERAAEVVTKGYGASAPQPRATSESGLTKSPTEEWRRYIDARIKQEMPKTNWSKVIGEMIAEHEITTRMQFEQYEERIKDLERRVGEQRQQLRNHIDREDLDERIAALEAAPANRLKLAK